MKRLNKAVSLIILPLIAGGILLTGCSKSDSLEKYYIEITQTSKIQNVFTQSAAKFNDANMIYQNAVKNGKKPDMAAITAACNAAVKILEDGKKTVEAVNTENADVKKYNDLLLSAINNQIGGYNDMLKGMAGNDEAMTSSGGAKIDQSGKDIDSWISGSPLK